MDKTKDNIAVSSLYTAGAWRWGRLPCADFVTPDGAQAVFRIVNLYMRFYRLVNPQVYSLKHQLLHRHAAIDSLLRLSPSARVIEVACGFSPRGSHVSASPQIEYIEIDLPEVVVRKRQQLESTPAGRVVLARPNFHLQPGDITTLDFAEEFGVHKSTAVVTEGLMMYFPRDVQMRIWRSIAFLLRKTGGLYLFDYIPLSDEPPRSTVGEWLHRFGQKVLKLTSDFAYDGRTRSDVAQDLADAGFADVKAIDTGTVAREWGLPQSSVPTRTIIYCCRAESRRANAGRA